MDGEFNIYESCSEHLPRINLYDRISLPEYENCEFKYLNSYGYTLKPDAKLNFSSDVILERSSPISNSWIVIKVLEEMIENLG